jgi:nucleotide-binding universal stress UspA family protein
MKRILVPTDFSVAAQDAFTFAQQIAERMEGAGLTAAHVFMPPMESEYPNMFPPVTELMEVREKMLSDFVEEYKYVPVGSVATSVKMDKELMIGFPADEIVEASKEYDLIIMGMTGENDIIDKVLGSVSISVAKRAECPVILVPKKAEFKGLRHMLYASNYESANEGMIKTLIDFNNHFNACVHFVHVAEKSEQDYDITRAGIFEELFEKGEPCFAFEMAEIEAGNVTEGLLSYAKDFPIDLMVIVNHRKHNFWDKLFHKSQTKLLANKANMPLMVFHLKD